MNDTSPIRLLLGPQRPVINVDKAMAHPAVGDGQVGVISAAWQEAEGDLDELQRLAGRSLFDIPLYKTADAMFAADPALHDAYRERQDQLIELQRMYRLRLRQLTVAARAIMRVEGSKSVIAEERRHAISQLRSLDRHHLRQIQKIHGRFDASFSCATNNAMVDHCAQIAETLNGCGTVLITGGNVAVLMNRLRLFGLGALLESKNIVAWSAGAMALTDRIVLFHDLLPQGRRDAELFDEGLGLVPGCVLLPDARGRLLSNAPVRTGLFGRRFAPATCLTLDNESQLLFRDGKVRESKLVRHIAQDGRFVRVKAA